MAEEIGAVFEDDLLVVREDEAEQAEVELHRAAVGEVGLAAEAAVPGFGDGEFLVVEHHLGERRAVAGALGADGFDDAFEGCVLGVLHFKGGVADAFEQRVEGLLAVECEAEGQGIDQGADEVAGGGVMAVRDGDRDDRIVIGTVAAQHQQEGGELHHEGRGAAGFRKGGDAGGEGSGQVFHHRTTGGRGADRTREIGGQVHDAGVAGEA